MRDKATWTSWVAVTVIGLGMVAGAFALRPDLKERFQDFFGLHFDSDEVETEELSELAKATQKKSKKKKKKSKRRPRNPADGQGPADQTDDDWEDIEFGNIFEEPDEIEVVETKPEFVPPPEMWKPDGRYTPSSAWTKQGFRPDAPTEITMTGPDQVPLTDYQVRQTLNEKLLMPCYREVAKKVPEMAGRVNFKGSVGHDGRVLHITVTRSALRSRVVEDCMVQTIKNTRFQRSQGQATTHFTMDFDFH